MRARLFVQVAVALLSTGAIACAEETITNQPDTDTEDQAGEGGEEQPAEEMAKVGDSITLSGNEEGLEMKVTVMTVQDPAKNLEAFTSPSKGGRFVGIQLKLENVGSAV